MDYKIPNIPLPTASVPELVDYMEVCCLKDGYAYSTTQVLSDMGILSEPSEEYELIENEGIADSMMNEVESRINHTAHHYPFEQNDSSISKPTAQSYVSSIYEFLLLVTRRSLSGSGRIVDDIDGTALFERLCALVVGNYFGNIKNAFVFGTGSLETRTFEEKMNDFLRRIQEPGHRFVSPKHALGKEKDGKVDVVVCIPFADKMEGRFIALGQCKAGTSWREQISSLSIKTFVDYIQPPLRFTPVALFLVAESFYDNWENLQSASGGVLFDRERIMQYLPAEEAIIAEDARLLDEIRTWNAGVLREIP